ncbi:flagellar basal body rod protein FlgB [Clostridium sp.]|mgnify:FL=1|uniref:flagellar basal body rod protein FlgB n=1 Tax=Clostridium sp. TaxID=1506 RepID=UPI0026311115|nr:flagellar basal body rod protein FlgB [uncultured Clostridium sp.]
MNVIGSSTSGDTYSLLKKSMEASTLRSKVSANNIANINTKNYKGLYVTFEDTLNDNMAADTMKTDNEKDIQASSGNGEIKVQRDVDTSARQDGNNVDIDLEMTNQAANSLMYDALVSQVNSKISLTSYVISGGR